MPKDTVHDETAAVRCYRCQYDLRGLAREGRCPECGEPVRYTLALIAEGAYGPPIRLAKGLTIAAWAALPLMFLGVLVPASPALAGFASAAVIACFRRRRRATIQEWRTTLVVTVSIALLVGLYVLLLLLLASINFC